MIGVKRWEPGIGQKELCKQLHLAPSTVTRFIDSMVHKGYLTRQSEGKASKVFSTKAGKKLRKPIEEAWGALYQRYAEILGLKKVMNLTAAIDAASDRN